MKKIRFIIAAAVTVIAIFGLSSAAVAVEKPQSASGCNFPTLKQAGACIAVRGTGNRVEAVRGGVILRPRAQLTVRWLIYDTKNRFSVRNLTDRKCSAGLTWTTCWGSWITKKPPFPLNLPAGDRICVKSYSRYAIYGPACETVG